MLPAAAPLDQNGSDNAHSIATARLQQEANEMRQRPPPVFPGRKIHDVTERFAAAARQLKPGQLVKDENFTLFEAVGALEVLINLCFAGPLQD